MLPTLSAPTTWNEQSQHSDNLSLFIHRFAASRMNSVSSDTRCSPTGFSTDIGMFPVDLYSWLDACSRGLIGFWTVTNFASLETTWWHFFWSIDIDFHKILSSLIRPSIRIDHVQNSATHSIVLTSSSLPDPLPGVLHLFWDRSTSLRWNLRVLLGRVHSCPHPRTFAIHYKSSDIDDDGISSLHPVCPSVRDCRVRPQSLQSSVRPIFIDWNQWTSAWQLMEVENVKIVCRFDTWLVVFRWGKLKRTWMGKRTDYW